MIDWDSLKDLLTINGIAYPIVREAFNYVKFRRRRKDVLVENQAQLEASVRSDLWNEIGNLRGAVISAQSSLIELQARMAALLSTHKNTIEELAETQQKFVKLSSLLTKALTALDKIEEVERAIDTPDLDKAKTEIMRMKTQAESIREKATVLCQT